MICRLRQYVASDAMPTKASTTLWTRNLQTSITLCFLGACCSCIAIRLLDYLLFGEDDSTTGELSAFLAFALGAWGCLRRQREGRRPLVKGVRSKGPSFPRRAPEQVSPGRRTRRVSIARQGPPLSPTDHTNVVFSDDSCRQEVDAALVEGILTACRCGDFRLADERLASVLSSLDRASTRIAVGCFLDATISAPGCPQLIRRVSNSGLPGHSQAHVLVAACIEAAEPQRAATWFEQLNTAGLWPGGKVLLEVLTALAGQDLSREAEEFFLRVLATGVQADAACYLLMFERCMLPGSLESVEIWLQRLMCRSPYEQAQGFMGLLRSKAQTKDAHQAERWMTRAIESGVPAGVQLYNAVIHACARCGATDRAEYWLQKMGEAESCEAGQRGRSSKARLTPDVFSYSTIMDSYAQLGETERAEAWFEKMVAAGITPDTVSFNTMIKAHSRGGNLGGAEKWLLMARAKGVRLDAFGYNPVIADAARALDPEKAEWWLLQMIQDGAEPDVVSYNSVINAWAKKGDALGAQRLVELMCEKDVEPDVVTLGVAVHACAKAGDYGRAEAIFKQIVLRGKTEPDAICYNALINAAVKAGDVAHAEGWLETMLKNGVAPSVVSYTTVLNAHARAGSIKKAEQCLECMLADGVEANVVSYSALVHACVKAGDVVRAEKWFNHMRGAGIQANAVSYSVLLNVCAKAGDYARAEKWLVRMLEDKVQPNVICYNNVIDACVKAAQPDRAEVWLRHLTGKCVSPDGTAVRPPEITPTRLSYTMVAQAYALQGTYSEVERLLVEMEEQGIIMDEFSLTVLISAYSRARPRKRDRAETAFREYVARGLPITKAPLRVLRSIVGAQRFEKLLADLSLSVECSEAHSALKQRDE